MELANHWLGSTDSLNGIRKATKSDAESILYLLKTAVYTHLHVDWYLPGDWIGAPGFVVMPRQDSGRKNLTAKLFQSSSDIAACLIATPDPLPAAWVRLVAIEAGTDAEKTLETMLASVMPALRKQGVTQLAWLALDDWPLRWLPQWGFTQSSEIQTYLKNDDELPSLSQTPGLKIRQVQSADFGALAALESVSFAPIWRQSARALSVAQPQSLSFDVAILNNEIVGYQLSARAEAGAHLVRLTVHPVKQGLGIGSRLLNHAIKNYHRRGLYAVSLNTQIENDSSQKLYQRFGFKSSDQRFPIWMMDIK